MTAPLYWARIGEHLTGPLRNVDVTVDGDSINRNVHGLPNPAGQLWERLAERAS